MAYMDDQALERDAIRQRILTGLPQIDFKGLPFEGPQAVKQTPGEPLRVAPVLGTRGTPTAAQPQQQSGGGIGDVIGGFLGGANVNRDSAIKQILAKREEWTKANPGKMPPWSEHAPAGVSTSPTEAGAPTSKTLAEQRAGYAAEMDGNPDLKFRMAALALAEEGGDGEARTALVETALNRGNANKMGPLINVLNEQYYAPFKDGGYAKAVKALQSNPALLKQVYSDIDRASHGGSNVSNFATDNGSGTVAESARRTQVPTFLGKNGEQFSRKEDPSIHGSWGTNGKAWYDQTKGPVADEATSQTPTKVAGDNAVPQPPPPSRGSLQPAATEQPASVLSSQSIKTAPAQLQPPQQQPGVTPQAVKPVPVTGAQQPQQAVPEAPPQQPPAPAAPAAAAPVPPPAPAAKLVGTPPAPAPVPKADLTGLHKWFDGNVVTGINEIMPGQGSNVPLLGRGMSMRSAAKMAPTDQVKPLIDAAAKKYGVTPKQLMEEVGKPPPAPGKSSEAEPPAGEQPQAVASAQPGPQGAPQQPAPTITPGEAKAVVDAVKPDAGPPVQTASAAPPPVVVPPPEPAPVNGAPGAGMPVVPNAPMPVQTSLAPNPMATAQINTPQSPFAMWQPPISWDTLQGWGWGGGGEGNTGFSGGNFDMAGGEGFSGFGGFGMPG